MNVFVFMKKDPELAKHLALPDILLTRMKGGGEGVRVAG